MKILMCLFAILVGNSAIAQNVDFGDMSTDDGWIPLQNEPSRQQLLNLTKTGMSAEVIPKIFHFPQDTLVDSTKNVDRTNSIFGIDISHYTPSNLPFAQLASENIHYVYAKATQGAAFKDPKFAQFWNVMGKLPANEKVYRGAYHFLSATDDAALQAQRFVAFLNLHGGLKSDDLPPVMDLEWDLASANSTDRWRRLTPATIESRVITFLRTVQQLTGRTPMIYTARSWWRSVGIPDADIKKFSQYPIWIADYSKSALAVETPAVPDNVKPTLWQFSESSKLSDGFAAGLDASIFYGTETDFVSMFFGQR